jgi:hypothetical protein
MARYTIKNALKVQLDIMNYCDVQQLDGAKLRDSLTYLLNYFELDSKLETKTFYKEAQSAIFKIGNMTGICSPENVAGYMDDTETWPEEFVNVTNTISNGIYVGLGMKIPKSSKTALNLLTLQSKAGSWCTCITGHVSAD